MMLKMHGAIAVALYLLRLEVMILLHTRRTCWVAMCLSSVPLHILFRKTGMGQQARAVRYLTADMRNVQK